MYAINLNDWHENRNSYLLNRLLSGHVSTDDINCEDGGIGGEALPLVCDDAKAVQLIEAVRVKYAPHQVRFYRNEGNRWRRV